LPILESEQVIDLLISDIGLPGMNGRELADRARIRRPDLRVLFVTGYADTLVGRARPLADGMAIVAKPFAVEVFASSVMAMLAEASREGVR
jgi:CheY-like chemotaxis protein